MLDTMLDWIDTRREYKRIDRINGYVDPKTGQVTYQSDKYKSCQCIACNILRWAIKTYVVITSVAFTLQTLYHAF